MLSPLLGTAYFKTEQTNTELFESKFFGAHFNSSSKTQPWAFWLLEQGNLEVNPPVYYPDNAAAITASRNLLEETGEQTAENMKVNTDIRKML